MDREPSLDRRPSGDRALANVDEADLIDLIAASERLVSWATSHQLAAIRELDRRRRNEGSRTEFTVDEVSAALTVSRVAAGIRMHLALALAHLPQVDDALTTGRIDVTKARTIADATGVLPPDLATQVADRVMPRAPGQTPGLLKASLARAVIAVSPQAAEIKRVAAIADRRVVITPVSDGMAELWAFLPAEGAMAIRTALDRSARARRGGGDMPVRDGRTADQRRADALVGWAVTALDVRPGNRVSGAGAFGHSCRRRERANLRHGLGCARYRRLRRHPGKADDEVAQSARPTDPPAAVRAHVFVTVPASTLLGISDEPGYLAGYGPITPETARLLAADGRWQRLLTDPVSGALLDHGRTTYAPPKALADHVIARDVTCVMPGCRRPAYQCDLDHTKCFPEGATCHDNLGPLCRTHHLLKHHTDWILEQPTPGTFVWTSPTGHTYVRLPPQLAPPISEELRRQFVEPMAGKPINGARRKRPDGRATPKSRTGSSAPPTKQLLARKRGFGCSV